MTDQRSAATEPLWWRIFWPIGKWTFLLLAATVLVLDVILIVRGRPLR